jgi:hypothetical protein
MGFLLLRRFRVVRLDLAGQRLTSEMVHGPEFGLTPVERERSSRCGLHTEGALLVAVLDFRRGISRAGMRRANVVACCRRTPVTAGASWDVPGIIGRPAARDWSSHPLS